MSVIEIEVANLYFHVTDITSIHRSDFFEVCFLIFYTFPILKFSNMLQTFGKNSSGLEATSQKRPQCGRGGEGGSRGGGGLGELQSFIHVYIPTVHTHTMCVLYNTHITCVCLYNKQPVCVGSESVLFTSPFCFGR